MDSEGKRRVIRISVWVAIIGLLLGVLSSLVMATGADAHAALRSISPEDGATLTSAPTKVVLTFSEPIGTSFATVSVAGADGSVSEGKAAVDGVTVTQALSPALPDGRYTVSFRVVSEDGHPVSDRTTFSVAAAATATPLPSTAPSSASTTSPPSTTAPTSALPADEDEGSGRAVPIGLAVGVAALALAAGTALIAATRRRSGREPRPGSGE